ncbi:MAG: class I SAM-dependent methyltransferase [Clostridia bacterium]|nr:class I SAM-dependent methyltransferase [Clostridia bacterium]
MSQSYDGLGGWFEYLNKDCGYEIWSQYLINRLNGLNAGRQGVDIGCGNGYFTRSLIKAGFDVKGVDISVRMLSKAKEISSREGVRAEFLLGDITKLKLTSKVDFAIAVNDCINYVPPEKLSAAFSHVSACLKKGGSFIFDISSGYKLKNIIGDNLFAEDTDDITYLWFNSFKGDRVEMDITVFEKTSNGAYARTDERHTQYIYELSFIKEQLLSSGFSFVECEGHLGQKLEENSQRINFICKK